MYILCEADRPGSFLSDFSVSLYFFSEVNKYICGKKKEERKRKCLEKDEAWLV